MYIYINPKTKNIEYINSDKNIDTNLICVDMPTEFNPSIHHKYNINTNSFEKDMDRIYIQTKQLRDTYLYKSDWTQSIDAPLTTEKKQEWATYRQALRDLDFTKDPIEWPTEPTK